MRAETSMPKEPQNGLKPVAMRTCMVTGTQHHKSEMIRFVAGPEGQLVADLHNRLGGRGAWVCAQHGYLQKALDPRKLSRHLGQQVQVGDDFLTRLAVALQARLFSCLSLMRKSGLLIVGGGSLRESKTALQGVLIADDASPREAADLIHFIQPDWIEEHIPSEILGKIARRDSIAYAGILKPRNPSDKQQIMQMKSALNGWRAATQDIKAETS